MALNLMARRASGPTCSMCRVRESAVRSVVVQPLISSLTTWLCPVCYPAYAASVDRMQAANSFLVVTEVAA